MKTTVAILVVLSTMLCAAAPPPFGPQVGTESFVRFTTVIPAEGVSVANIIATNVAAGKQYTSHAGSDGFYAKLIRNDLNATYYFHMVDGNMMCLKTKSSPMYTPTFRFPYNSQTFFNGRSVNVYKVAVNKYILTAYSDIETGNIAGVINPETLNSVQMVDTYLNTSSPTDPIYDLPYSCINATELEVEAPSSPRGGDGGEGFLHHRTVLGSRTRALFPPRAAFMRQHERVAESHPELRYTRVGIALPDSVDNSAYATPVRDQSQCGACWAFSTAGLAELVRNKALGYTSNYSVFEWYSPQAMIDCVHERGPGDIAFAFGCQGGSPFGSLLHMVAHGIPRDYQYGYTAVDGKTCRTANMTVEYPIASAKMLNVNVVRNFTTMVESMMEAITLYGGVVAIINEIGGVYGDLTYSGGIYNEAICTPGLSHAVLIVGYGTDPATGLAYWKVKNSFGGAWGEGGYFRIARGVNMCGIEDFIYVATPNKTSTS